MLPVVLLFLLTGLAGSALGQTRDGLTVPRPDAQSQKSPLQQTEDGDIYLLTMDSTFHVVHFSGDPLFGTTFDMQATANVYLPSPPPYNPSGLREGSGFIDLVSMSGVTRQGALQCSIPGFAGTLKAQGQISPASIQGLRLLPESASSVTCWLVIQSSVQVSMYNLWFTSLYGMHMDEMDHLALSQGMLIENWTMVNDGNVVAEKIYQQYKEFDDGETLTQVTENTVLRILALPPLPDVSEIYAMGYHTAGDRPTTGREVYVCVDVGSSDDYELADCRWSGDLPPGQGDPEQGCRYEYTPEADHGPHPNTYGDKDVNLLMYFRHKATGSVVWKLVTGQYKVFFAKHGLDQGTDGNPNWFEYWADDGAVPGLDAPDVAYDPSANYGRYGSGEDMVYVGPLASEIHYDPPYVLDWTIFCPGGTFGGAEGIDSVAEVLAHERRHQQISYHWDFPSQDSCSDPDGTWGGCADTDGDELSDAYETGVRLTSPDVPDSCELAIVKAQSYRDNGDQELDCMIAGDGQLGVSENDWANPGMQSQEIIVNPCGLGSGPSGLVSAADAVDRGAVEPPSARRALVESMNYAAADATLSGQYAEEAVDTDGDGLHDGLKLSVGLVVDVASRYNVVAWLENSSGGAITWAAQQGELEAGSQIAEMFFDGAQIWASGTDGPYTVARVELRAGDHERVLDEADDVLTTAAYSHTDFDPPAVTFNGQFVDMTRTIRPTSETMDDLVIRVGLDVHEAGRYMLLAVLSAGDETIAVDRQVVNRPAGSYDVVVVFPREAIHDHRADGPFTLKTLSLTDERDDLLAHMRDAFATTKTYVYTQFAYGDAILDHTLLSEQAVDSDGDGLCDSLDVDFTVVTEGYAGYYLTGVLEDGSGRTIVRAQTYPAGMLTEPPTSPLPLAEGRVLTGTLSFSGEAIRNHGVDGPYVVAALVLMRADGVQVDYLPMALTTGVYRYTEFFSAATPTPTVTFTPTNTPTGATATQTPVTPRPTFTLQPSVTSGPSVTPSPTRTPGAPSATPTQRPPRPSLTPAITRRPPKRIRINLPLVLR